MLMIRRLWRPVLAGSLKWFARLTLLLTLTGLLYHSIPQTNLYTTTAAIVAGRGFNFVSWTAEALTLKATTSLAAAPQFADDAARSDFVRTYVALTDRLLQVEREINTIYTDPMIADPASAAAERLTERNALRAELNQRQPLAEAILQEQVAQILRDEGFTLAGQPVPPVAFHVTPLPRILIISARDRIEQIHAVSIRPDLSLAEQEQIEAEITASLNASAYITPIGGLAIYPTMIYETSNLPYLTEIIAHEWAHNWLTLRPLGLNYSTTNDLRTINETTATIFGREIGQQVLQRFYPELYTPPAPAPAPPQPAAPPPPPDPDRFDFRAEMYTTRVIAEALLAAGKIEAAEAYMEARRAIFVENGYNIRKLNQAYFAFHGAYAPSPGGAAGQDPIGPMVSALRDRHPTLLSFMNDIAWVTTVDQLSDRLDRAIANTPPLTAR